ncbi:MAG: hypothetical protein RMJ13_04430 [Elusimicrobiota bacterium]|nr:hypothetical protein [Elusimicrobiota bacterium]
MSTEKFIKSDIYKKCKDSTAALVFFIIGLIATISIRAIGVVANIVGEIGTKILWYIGVVGFLLFFIYKYNIEKRRRKIIFENAILEKISINSELEQKDKEVLGSLICSLISTKDAINYFVIFFTSAISLVIALLYDLGMIGG